MTPLNGRFSPAKSWPIFTANCHTEKEVAIRQLHEQGYSIAAIARTLGLTRKTIYRALGRELVGS